MTGPPLAFFDFDVAQFIVNCFAVAGGFLVGYTLAGIVTWWIDRTFLRKKTPDIFRQSARVVGGSLLALLIALLVFGRGGGGLGGGLGEDIGSGVSGPNVGPGSDPSSDPIEPPRPTPPEPTTIPLTAERMRVTMLGGPDVKDQRFYLIDDDATPRTLAEARLAIQARRDATEKPVAIEIQFSTRHTLPRDHPAVTLLTNWARDAGLTVVFPAEMP
jgi:hypothetical protein